MIDIPVDIGGKEYRIQSDAKNFMISRKSIDKKTKGESWQGFMFYPTIDSLIKSLLTLKLRASEARDLGTLQADMHHYTQQLRGLYEMEEFE